jgi:hypothetical protein
MRWLRASGVPTLHSWDFYVAAALGAVAFGLAFDDAVRKGGVTMLIAEAAIGVALTSTVLGGLAIFSGSLDAAYRAVLEAAGGVQAALRPYLVVGVVSGAAAVGGTVCALALPAFGEVPVALMLGVKPGRQASDAPVTIFRTTSH